MSIKYSEKLKDPRWQKKRLEILDRDRWSCRGCGDKESTLHVHHIAYFPGFEPWDISSGFLITLCGNCHKPSCESGPYEQDIPNGLVGSIGAVLDLIWNREGDFVDVLWEAYKAAKETL